MSIGHTRITHTQIIYIHPCTDLADDYHILPLSLPIDEDELEPVGGELHGGGECSHILEPIHEAVSVIDDGDATRQPECIC